MIYNATARGLLHGVTVPETACFTLTRSPEDGDTTTGTVNFGETNSISECGNLFFTAGIVAELRDGNRTLFQTTVNPIAFQTSVQTKFTRSWLSSESSFLKPEDIPQVDFTIIGVESGAQTTFAAHPINTAQSMLSIGCFFLEPGPSLVLQTTGGPQSFYRARWIMIDTFDFPTGNADTGDVKEVVYAEWLFSVDNMSPNTVDWEASGYFLPGEECYFEGCPPPYYPTPYTGQIAWGGAAINPGGDLDYFTCSGSTYATVPNGGFVATARQPTNQRFNLAFNTIPFIWEEALVVFTDPRLSGLSILFPVCPVASGLGSTGRRLYSYYLNGFYNFGGAPPTVYQGEYRFGGTYPNCPSDFNGPVLNPNVSDCYLWFPGAAAA